MTQLGTGNALVVEDSTNPDSTPFVVDASGNVGIGTSNPSVELEVSGVVSVNTGYVTLNNNKVGGIQVTIADDAYAEITPPRVGAHFMAITEDGDNPFPINGCYGFVSADFGSSAALAEISVGPNFETSTSGPPTGTTGNDAHATLFVGGTSGKIYLENRLGVTGVFQITFL